MSVSARIFQGGSVVVPIAGTVRRRGGEAIGVWGDPDNRVVEHIMEADGTARPATEAELRMIEAIWGPRGRPAALGRGGMR